MAPKIRIDMHQSCSGARDVRGKVEGLAGSIPLFLRWIAHWGRKGPEKNKGKGKKKSKNMPGRADDPSTTKLFTKIAPSELKCFISTKVALSSIKITPLGTKVALSGTKLCFAGHHY
jgi:hypothetical protein